IDAGGSVEETGQQWQSARRVPLHQRGSVRLAIDAASASEGDAASSSSMRKAAALWVATLLTLGLVGVLGYTQWWIPREQAQQRAQVEHEHCLQEMKVYSGKRNDKARLDQC